MSEIQLKRRRRCFLHHSLEYVNLFPSLYLVY
jgi:hypothetical protein